MSKSSSPLLREEIAELLKKRAVERVRNSVTPCFYSRLFLVPKKNGKLLPVIDHSLLNQYINKNKGKRKVQGVPQSQTAALPRHQEEEETDKSKQAQIEQTYEKH